MDTTSPTANPTPLAPRASGVGALIGVIIVVLLLAAGGAYYFLLQPRSELVVSEGGVSDNSDKVSSVEADVNAAGEADVEGELSNLEQSL